MAWITVNLDATLVMKGPDPMTGEETETVIDGAVDSMNQLTQEGHRLTVFTSRFAPMPESEKQRLKEEIEEQLMGYGFPPMEVWTGTTKPASDLYIGAEAVTFDQDWGLALAQMQYMLEERGLVPPPPPDGDASLAADDGAPPPPDEEADGSMGQ